MKIYLIQFSIILLTFNNFTFYNAAESSGTKERMQTREGTMRVNSSEYLKLKWQLEEETQQSEPEAHQLDTLSGIEQSTGSVRKRHIRWTDQLCNELLHIWRNTPAKTKYHSSTVYQEWIRIHPEHAHLTPKVLCKQARRIDRAKCDRMKYLHGDGEGTSQYFSRHVKWTQQLKDDLLLCHRESFVGKRVNPKLLYSKWEGMHPNLPKVSMRHLLKYAGRLARMSKNREKQNEVIGEIPRNSTAEPPPHLDYPGTDMDEIPYSLDTPGYHHQLHLDDPLFTPQHDYCIPFDYFDDYVNHQNDPPE